MNRTGICTTPVKKPEGSNIKYFIVRKFNHNIGSLTFIGTETKFTT